MPSFEEKYGDGSVGNEADGDTIKEYQTLFWVPMLFQTAKNAESLIDEMLEMIDEFHSQEVTPGVRKSILDKRANGTTQKRRQQILGDVLDSEAITTRVDVVMKSESTKFQLLAVLKQHFLFSQLRDYELEDVVDVMQFQYVGRDEVIIKEGDPGDLFYILEEGKLHSLVPEFLPDCYAVFAIVVAIRRVHDLQE